MRFFRLGADLLRCLADDLDQLGQSQSQHVVVESLARRTRREFDSAFGGIAQWRSRASSADFVRHQGGPHDLAAEVAAEIRTGSEVDVSAEELRQFEFDRGDPEESG